MQEVKAYRTSDGELVMCKALAVKRELSLLLDKAECLDDIVETLIENDGRVVALLQEHRRAQPTMRGESAA